MKTLMNMMIALLLLMANITIAQAINYPTYNSSTQAVYVTPSSLTPGYKAGDEVLQTNSLTPLVNSNGMAVEPYSAAPGRPRRTAPVGWDCSVNGHYDENEDGECDVCEVRCIKGEGVHAGTPGGSVDDGRLPIGSIMILLLFALLHVAYIAYSTSVRRQK